MITKSPLTYSPKDLIVIKNSPQRTTLEQFVEELYANMRDVHSAKIINLIEHYKNIA